MAIKKQTKKQTAVDQPVTDAEKLQMAESANKKLMQLVSDLSAELHKKSGQLDELRARRKQELMEAVNEAQANFEQQQAHQVNEQLAQQAERFTALLNNLAVDIVTPAGEVGKAVFTPAAGMVTYDQIREVLQAVATADYELYLSLSPYQLVMVGCFLLAYGTKGD